MNRRSFFSRLLGAACLAVAERVMPSSIAGTVKPMFAEPDWQQWGSYRVYLPNDRTLPTPLLGEKIYYASLAGKTTIRAYLE